MTKKECEEYLIYLNTLGSRPGLESTLELCRRLGDPQKNLHFIHVAGTNGKGSVCAFLDAALSQAGFRVGRFTSPAVLCYRERFLCNGRMISEKMLGDLMQTIREICEGMTADGLAHPTAFEVETALAFLFFARKKCDIVILECGMGGLLDATNVIEDPMMAVITSIGMDHAQFLGDSLAKIAEQKAGIIKPGCTVVSAAQEPEVRKVLEKTCKEKGARLFFCKSDEIDKIRCGLKKQSFRFGGKHTLTISLAGAYQIDNAHLAAKALYVLADNAKNPGLTDKTIAEGLRQAAWPGRFEILSDRPLLIADGAHNRPGAAALADSLRAYFPDKRLIFILGIFRDKDCEGMLEETASLAEQILTVTLPDHTRSLDALSLARTVTKYNPHVTTADSIPEALELARLLAGKEGVIVAFGSLSLYRQLKAFTERKQK